MLHMPPKLTSQCMPLSSLISFLSIQLQKEHPECTKKIFRQGDSMLEGMFVSGPEVLRDLRCDEIR